MNHGEPELVGVDGVVEDRVETIQFVVGSVSAKELNGLEYLPLATQQLRNLLFPAILKRWPVWVV